MKLWKFVNLRDDDYADASRTGTWAKMGDPPRDVRVKPIVIEWEPGSKRVGDFTYPGFGSSDLIVTERVLRAFEQQGFKGFEPGPVVMRRNRQVKKRDEKRTVTLPYEGPELFDLYVTHWVTFDREHSTFKKVEDDDYGCQQLEPEGCEQWVIHVHPDPDGMYNSTRERVPREPGRGIFVRADQIEGYDIFKIREFPAAIRCTDRVRDFILENKFTNVDFFEIGETLPTSGQENKRKAKR